MHFAVGNVDNRGNVTAQINPRVIFTAALALRKCAHRNTLSDRSIVVVSKATRIIQINREARRLRKAAAAARSSCSRNRDKYANRVSRSHRPDCCERRVRECRDDKASPHPHVNRLRYRASFRETLIAQTPCSDIDRDVKRFWSENSKGNAQSNAGTYRVEERP